MEYYVIYDLNDNLLWYIDNKFELSKFTGLELKRINYRFKNVNYINHYFNNILCRIYKFS